MLIPVIEILKNFMEECNGIWCDLRIFYPVQVFVQKLSVDEKIDDCSKKRDFIKTYDQPGAN